MSRRRGGEEQEERGEEQEERGETVSWVAMDASEQSGGCCRQAPYLCHHARPPGTHRRGAGQTSRWLRKKELE